MTTTWGDPLGLLPGDTASPTLTGLLGGNPVDTVNNTVNTVQTIAWIGAGLVVALGVLWLYESAKSPGGVSGRVSGYAASASPYVKKAALLAMA